MCGVWPGSDAGGVVAGGRDSRRFRRPTPPPAGPPSAFVTSSGAASPPRSSPSPERRTVALAAGIGVAVLVILGSLTGLWFATQRTPASQVAAAPSPIATAPAAAPSSSFRPASTKAAAPAPTPTPSRVVVTVTATAAAPTVLAPDPATELARLRAAGVGSLVLDGHWVVQLASKYDGVVDSTQTAANGGHTFGNADILAEHVALRARFGSRVLLIGGNDMGKRWNGPQTLWTTLYDPGTFGSQAAADAWCRSTFPGMTDQARANVCFSRQAKPPYS